MANVLIPEFQLDEKTHPGNVALKVNDLQKMILFYTQVIGLRLLAQNTQQATLGAGHTAPHDKKRVFIILLFFYPLEKT